MINQANNSGHGVGHSAHLVVIHERETHTTVWDQPACCSSTLCTRPSSLRDSSWEHNTSNKCGRIVTHPPEGLMGRDGMHLLLQSATALTASPICSVLTDSILGYQTEHWILGLPRAAFHIHLLKSGLWIFWVGTALLIQSLSELLIKISLMINIGNALLEFRKRH